MTNKPSQLEKLNPNERRGSKARCHWLTHGTKKQVSERLTQIISPYGEVSADDEWMPKGFRKTKEPELHKRTCNLVRKETRDQIRTWWFKIKRGYQRGASFDIASTCKVNRKHGILLIEAKAHNRELLAEEKGKTLKDIPTNGELINHQHVGKAIAWANDRLIANTGLYWQLSRDRHYQMSNRFAYSCKLTELGFPVLLVYLGFLNANEMEDKGQPFDNHKQWENLVKSQSRQIIDPEIWNNKWIIHQQIFVPLIRSTDIPYQSATKSFRIT